MDNHPAQKHAYLIIPIALLALVLFGAGCTKKAAEQTAEKAIESTTNGQADVDIDNDQVTVNTNAGSWQVGESVSLPSGFPEDVYVINGTIKSAMTLTENEGYTVAIETNVTWSQAKTTYESELAEDGWTIASTYSTTNGAILSAQKADRVTTVSISEADGKTSVVISTNTQSGD